MHRIVMATARCSWLEACWPGTCYDENNSTESCQCTEGFTLNNSSGKTICDCKFICNVFITSHIQKFE